MLDTKLTSEAGRERGLRTHDKPYSGDKYLCDVCGTIPGLEHEVRPATLPYVSGNYDFLN